MTGDFDRWRQEVNSCLGLIGYTIADMPAGPLQEWHRFGVTPGRAAGELAKLAASARADRILGSAGYWTAGAKGGAP